MNEHKDAQPQKRTPRNENEVSALVGGLGGMVAAALPEDEDIAFCLWVFERLNGGWSSYASNGDPDITIPAIDELTARMRRERAVERHGQEKMPTSDTPVAVTLTVEEWLVIGRAIQTCLGSMPGIGQLRKLPPSIRDTAAKAGQELSIVSAKVATQLITNSPTPGQKAAVP